MIKVLIADDHEVVRSGFSLIINSQDDMEVVGNAADGNEAYNLVAKLKPDILLLDISMPPGQSGLIACEKISKDFPSTRVIILTMFAEADYLYFTLRGGASGYILKTSSTEELLEAVREVAAGGIHVNQKMAEELSIRLKEDEDGEGTNPLRILTSRELEVFTLIASGYTTTEIAEKIYVSVKTVEVHRSKIYSKLNISSRAELVQLAIKYRLLGL